MNRGGLNLRLSKTTIDDLRSRLREGTEWGEGRFYAVKVKVGRFAEEEDFVMVLEDKHILTVKLFYGREPYWKPWAELFDIDTSFFESPAEDWLYRLLSDRFDRLFVEYYTDPKTMWELKKGVPVEETRLGKKLRDLGYVRFRDWYIPEGGREGGYKIQAER